MLDDVRLDPIAHVVRLSLSVVEGGITSQHKIVMTGVSSLQFHNAIPDPWNYAEVTEISIDRDGPDRYSVRLVLWSEAAGLEVKCRVVQRHESHE
jgi:hypothetical protein